MINDLKFLKMAVAEAKKSINLGGFPAGAVLVKNNKVIAHGVSLGFKLHNPTSHAETSAVRKACKKLQTTDLANTTLYASLQPCIMCYSAANWANISRIVYGCHKTADMVAQRYYEGNNDLGQINDNNIHRIEIEFIPAFESQMLQIVKDWEMKNAKN